MLVAIDKTDRKRIPINLLSHSQPKEIVNSQGKKSTAKSDPKMKSPIQKESNSQKESLMQTESVLSHVKGKTSTRKKKSGKMIDNYLS